MKEQMKQWADLNKAAVATMQKFADLNSSIANSLLNQQMDVVSSYADSSAKQLKSLSEAKRIQDVMSIQAEALQELNKKALENSRSTMEILVDGKNKVTALVEESVKEASSYNPFAKVAA
jgi:phasin family protein